MITSFTTLHHRHIVKYSRLQPHYLPLCLEKGGVVEGKHAIVNEISWRINVLQAWSAAGSDLITCTPSPCRKDVPYMKKKKEEEEKKEALGIGSQIAFL